MNRTMHKSGHKTDYILKAVTVLSIYLHTGRHVQTSFRRHWNVETVECLIFQ